jgi:hypothetical protein
MNCRHCSKEIKKSGFDWVHIETRRYRCGNDGPAPDPQHYAEPFYPESFDNPKLIGDQS